MAVKIGRFGLEVFPLSKVWIFITKGFSDVTMFNERVVVYLLTAD